MNRWIVGLVLAVGCGVAGAQSQHFFASQVVRYSPGVGNSLFPDANLALAGPQGYGYPNGSLHVVTLGVRGELVLGFGPGQYVADAPGKDLIVFENAFGADAARFAELVKVGVSTNGQDFAFFPTWCGITSPVASYAPIDSSMVSGFAGVTPVFANTGVPPLGNSIDPFDPEQAGGDAFDLSSLASDPLVLSGKVNLGQIRYVLLKDVWGDGSELDSQGNRIYDPTGTMDPPYSNVTSADIDALSAISGRQALAGDCNYDGKVRFADYLVLEQNFGKTGKSWVEGDFTGDGAVKFADYLLLEQNFGKSAAPEPATIVLLAAGAAAIVRKRA